MEFKKKLKIRLYTAIAYMVLGAAMIVVFNLVVKNATAFLSSFGFALLVIGFANLRRYRLITKSEETIRSREIAETDERNIFIAHKARSAAFILYTVLTCTAVIVLELLNQTELAMILSGTICVLLVIYWVSYWIIRKRS